jgi:peptide/nickel transport system substrate-binding protein
MKFEKGLLACASFALSLSVLVGAHTAPAMAQEATFVVPTDRVGSTSYNPIKSIMMSPAASLIYDRMVIADADLSFHGQLATSWETSPDGMEWTFKLRQGVKFHDGEPFDARTIEWWVSAFKGTENEYLVSAIDKVVVVDDYTVKFLMKHPEPNLLSNMSAEAMGVPAPNAYKEMGDDFGVTGAVGSGPFKLESFAIGQETVLTRYDEYNSASDLSENQGPAKIERLTYREIPENSTAFLEMKTQGVDMLMSTPNDFLADLGQNPSVGLMTSPGIVVMYMAINTSVEPFTDIRVREAAALAINQKDILDSIFGGVGSEAHTFLISSLAESRVDPKYAIGFDPEKAKAVLDEAGWKPGADGIRVKDGKPLTVKLWTQSDTEFRRVTEAVQAQLKAIGMNAEITVFDSSTIRDQYKKNEHQLAVRSYSWPNADILDWFFNGDRLGYPNISMWNDAKSQELDKKAMSGSKSWEERVANFKAFHEYLLSQYTFAPIYQPAISIAYNKDKLEMPKTIRGIQIESQTVLDIGVKE